MSAITISLLSFLGGLIIGVFYILFIQGAFYNSGQSRESYLRMCINGLVPRPAPSVELVEVTQVLRQIAESINGIAGAVYKQNKMDDSVYMENYEVLQKQINEIMILIRQPINMEEVWQSQKYGQ